MMKALLRALLTTALLVSLFGGQRVLALAGTLQRPSLSFPTSADPAWQASVMKVLDERPQEFLGGEFVNAATTLRYRGPVHSLNQFLAGLAACPGLRIQVTFDRNQEDAWTVRHNAWSDPEYIQVIIHPGAESFRIEALQLPEMRGSAAPAGPKPSAPAAE